MTVLQIVKGLIGEEDVNFGDSDTTFTRQTHTGGTTTIHYIDSKSLPANTLGGVVDTHLHTQNTDTGTTADTFEINSDGNGATLSTAGLSADRTYTFPATSQALAGASNLSSTSTGYGASMIGIEDSAGNFSSTTVEDALGELAVSVAGQTEFRGYKRGFKLSYSSTTAITIAAGMWDHRGTTNQNVYTTSQLTFTLGSGGSNAGSSALGASELQYIYIDDSAVVTAGTALLTASEFLNSTTAPAWSNTKCGWYNGNDRCIGATYTNGSSQVMNFCVYSSALCAYVTDYPEVRADGAAPTSATQMDLSAYVPVFCTRIKLLITATTENQAIVFGPGSAALDIDCFVAPTDVDALYSIEVLLNSSQSTWITASVAGNITVDLAGYYMDEL